MTSYQEPIIGQTGALRREFGELEVSRFSELTLDVNPLHLDEHYAHQTRFQRRIVNGGLIAGLLGSVMGGVLPGPGTVLVKQDLNFYAPLFLGEFVTAEVEVEDYQSANGVTRLLLRCSKDNGDMILLGSAIAIYRPNPS